MQARALFFMIAMAVAIAGCAPRSALSDAVRPPPHGNYTDKQLYREITAEVARGVPYYAAAARLHRAHRYPLKPGLTVRLPTLTLAAAALGWDRLRGIAFALLAGTALVWFLALRGKMAWPERLAAAGAVAAGGAMLGGDPMILHERWAGLLLGLALALRIGWRDKWLWPLAAVGVALTLRELALPFALLAAALAAGERRWRELGAWAVLIALFLGLLGLHLQLVATQIRAGDLATQGWNAFGGIPALVGSIVQTSPLQYAPAPVAIVLALAPLAGWLALESRDRAFCMLLFAGYALMIALFARRDNFYWGAIVQPAWFVGLILVPRAASRAWQSLRRQRAGAANLAGTHARL